MSLFGLVSFQNQYFPYVLMALDLLMGGPQAAGVSLTGIISGYAWWYLVHNDEAGRPGAEYARAPNWLRKLVEGARETGGRNTSGDGPVGQPPRNPLREVRQETTNGYTWGRGQRLGAR